MCRIQIQKRGEGGIGSIESIKSTKMFFQKKKTDQFVDGSILKRTTMGCVVAILDTDVGHVGNPEKKVVTLISVFEGRKKGRRRTL